ncbi:hypothetical protein N7530_012541 [Penicillium desertorum]|uniref:Uncharacterized protein n=1 Tax=Penicillium desertorum TaxID=1303715 RepID=A0A9W9WFV9_9EURO|nr:hypothetical protein N7530_012541 [Penicillium desertorum]
MSGSQSQARKRQPAAKLGRIDDFYIPADEEDWNELVQNGNLAKDTIHTIPADRIASASEASNAQYVMLRSYSPPMRRIDDFLGKCHQFGFTSEVRGRADNLLAASTEWLRYLQLLDTNDSVNDILDTSNRWPGAFSTVKRLQEQTMTVRGVHDRDVMQVATEGTGQQPGGAGRPKPHRITQLPQAEDEATPNAALITLLQSVSHFAQAKLEWIFNHVHFTCKLRQTEFSALTDGGLRSKRTMDIFAIVEVKKRMRTEDTYPILMQEACEVAGWLMDSPVQMAHFGGHFMLISQDRHEIFVTFVPFHQGYENYLRNGSNTNTFLVMNTFGPFHTAYRNDMEEFGRIILAAILIVKHAA